MNRMIAQYRFTLHKIVRICATEVYDLQLRRYHDIGLCTLRACILTRTCWLDQNVTYPYYLLQFMLLLEQIYTQCNVKFKSGTDHSFVSIVEN